MRLPFALLSFPLFPLISSLQVPLTVNTTSVTIVDVLSQDPDYESLIHLLQRTKLIPTLNKLKGATFFAPTNKAIRKADLDLGDNVQHTLRQRLFYHLLNYTLPPDDDTDTQLEVLSTLYYPDLPLEPPGHEPPPSPPWLPVPGGTLGGKPQLLRMTGRDRVAVDAFGKGGINIVKDKVVAANGVVLGIDKLIETPPNLAEVVSSRSELSYFTRVLAPLPSVVNFLNSTPALTLFLPVDLAWDAFDPLERLYLESEFAADDLQHILQRHAVLDLELEQLEESERVIYADMMRHGINLTTLSSHKLSVEPKDDKIIINDSSELVHPDIYASNGVLHLVSSLLMNPDSLKITTEKYLLALNCTRFISLLHSVGLQSLVNDTEPRTVLAISDDVLALYGLDSPSPLKEQIPDPGSDKLERILRYHFIDGSFSPDSLSDGQLLKTALTEESGLQGGNQMIKVEVQSKGLAETAIKFGGAGVIGAPVPLRGTGTIVYFLSRPLTPPPTVQQAALPRLHLSTFFAAISSLNVPDHPPTEPITSHPLTTFMVPHNDAFSAVGDLVTKWLMGDSEESKADLARAIRHHVIDGVIYTNDLIAHERRTYKTLEGSDVEIRIAAASSNNGDKGDKDKDGKTRAMSIIPSGGWSGLQASVYPQDLLTNTGVLHEISDLLIPRTVVIGIGKLMQAAGGTTMKGLVVRSGMGWVLTGEEPPEDSEYHDMKGVAWTLLCPKDDAFRKYNLTELYANQILMEEIVKQHLIPTPPSISKALAASTVTNRPLVMDDDATYNTALSRASAYGDIIFKRNDAGSKPGYVVGIKGARGTDGKEDWAKVISWGRSTPGVVSNSTTTDGATELSAFAWAGQGGGGVISIDRIISPYHPPWWISWGQPVAGGAAGIIVICGFFWAVNILWRKDVTEATYEPVGGFGRADEEDDG